jgi:hypothetical protein
MGALLTRRPEPGDSGCWVTDRTTGDLLGVVVAASDAERYGYMLRATEIVAAIAAKQQPDKGGSLVLPSRELFSSDVSMGQRMLVQAVKTGNVATVSLLLHQELTKVEVCGEQGDRLLDIARTKGLTAIERLLLEAGAGPSKDLNYPAPDITLHRKPQMAISHVSEYYQSLKPPRTRTRRRRSRRSVVRTGCITCRVSLPLVRR